MHCEPMGLQYDSTETALRIKKIFEPVEKFLLGGDSDANALRLTANALRMHCECAANALRMRCECAANALRLCRDFEN